MRSALPCSRISNVFVSPPTDEDKYWFPDIAGSDWLETLHFAMRDFKDESFIRPVPVAKSDA
ncbi:Stage V sporulation protein involved in spore cortex synthesis (SpoVR) [Salmonella enterica subsp. enterica]|uniref:Stage V sporulation protein involved in spore cortex synthesis (SpoVR) n=1 Tax=Salmonella enterica I TaxID=59201 RepID=A0A447U202_SALET|nr:Stage V sporulation protein involved in spore cortex synthesis (SpoVR) [Salmonella enterica subsp. enterica]